MNVMVTYDLHDATEEMHAKAMQLLLANGYKRSLPAGNGGQVPLPQTTVVGQTNSSADQIRDWVWAKFADAQVRPKRVAVMKHNEQPSAKFSS